MGSGGQPRSQHPSIPASPPARSLISSRLRVRLRVRLLHPPTPCHGWPSRTELAPPSARPWSCYSRREAQCLITMPCCTSCKRKKGGGENPTKVPAPRPSQSAPSCPVLGDDAQQNGPELGPGSLSQLVPARLIGPPTWRAFPLLAGVATGAGTERPQQPCRATLQWGGHEAYRTIPVLTMLYLYCVFCTEYKIPSRSAFPDTITRCDGRFHGFASAGRVTVASASSADTDTRSAVIKKARFAVFVPCTSVRLYEIGQSRSLPPPSTITPSPDGQRDPLGSFCCCWPSGLVSAGLDCKRAPAKASAASRLKD